MNQQRNGLDIEGGRREIDGQQGVFRLREYNA
jgi:hypothetical protein